MCLRLRMSFVVLVFYTQQKCMVYKKSYWCLNVCFVNEVFSANFFVRPKSRVIEICILNLSIVKIACTFVCRSRNNFV